MGTTATVVEFVRSTGFADIPAPVYEIAKEHILDGFGVAEERKAAGKDLVLSYVLGVEVACRLADAIAPRHYQHGFHSTATLGGFGSAAAVGRLLGLDADALARAFGLAGSLAGGLRENFGTMTKPFHSGRAAYHRVLACLLAAGGRARGQVQPAVLHGRGRGATPRRAA